MTKDYCYAKVAELTMSNQSKNTTAGMAVVFVSSHHDGAGKRRTTLDVYPDKEKATAAAAAMREAGGESAPADHHQSRSTGRSHILPGLSDAQMRRVYLDYMKLVDEDEDDDADPLIGLVIKGASLATIDASGQMKNSITDVTVCLAEMEHSRDHAYDITYDVGNGRERSTRSKQAVREMQDEADRREDGGAGEDTRTTALDVGVQAAGAPLIYSLARRLSMSVALMSAPGVKELSSVDCVQLARFSGLEVSRAAADTEVAHLAAGSEAMIALEVALAAATARYDAKEATKRGSGGAAPEVAGPADRAKLATQLRHFFSNAPAAGRSAGGKAPSRSTPRVAALRARLDDPNDWEEVPNKKFTLSPGHPWGYVKRPRASHRRVMAPVRSTQPPKSTFSL